MTVLQELKKTIEKLKVQLEVEKQRTREVIIQTSCPILGQATTRYTAPSKGRNAILFPPENTPRRSTVTLSHFALLAMLVIG